MRLCAASRPVSSIAAEQNHLAGLPRQNLFAGHLIEIDAARVGRAVGELGPVTERRRLERNRARAVEYEVRVTSRGAVGDHRNRQIGGVRRIVLHLYVEHRGESAEALGANAEGVDLVIELQAQLFGAVLGSACFNS